MLRILFFTDPHLRATRPISRLDKDFAETVLGKIRQVRDLSESGYDAVIVGGDIFDRPDPPHSIVTQAIKAFKSFPVPVYTVIGNHDIYGYQGASIKTSAIGTLLESGAVKQLNYVCIKGVHFCGIHAYDKSEWVLPDMDGIKIMVAHKMITATPIPNTECISLAAVAQATNADVILSGDIHYPHNDTINGKLFMNPGSISRLSIVDRSRMPQAAELVVEEDGEVIINLHALSARPAETVFDLKNYSEKMASEAHTKEFTRTFAHAVVSVKADVNRVGPALEEFMEQNGVERDVRKLVTIYRDRAEKEVLKEVKD